MGKYIELVMHVAQDGNDFYIYDGPDSREDRKLLGTRTYPGLVDMNDPKTWEAARKWFKELCNKKTQDTMVWL